MNTDQYAIIADPESKIWPFASAVYENLKNRDSGFFLNPVKMKRFPTGEFKPVVAHNVRGRACYYFPDPMQDPSRWFTEICLVNSALERAHAREIVDVLTYMPFARQDRKDEARTSISIKMVAKAVGYFGATNVMTLDLHSEQSDGLFDVPTDPLHSFPVVVNHLKKHHPRMLENLIYQSTDVGGGKRTSRVARAAGSDELGFGYKARSKAGKVDNVRIIGDVAGRNVLYIDDLIDSGETLDTNATEVRWQGATSVSAYCTFSFFTKGVDAAVRNLDKLFTSDVITPPQHPKIEVISMMPLFAEAIYRASQNESISELFS